MKIFGTDYDGVIINIEPQKAEAFGNLLNKEWNIDKQEASKLWIATGGTSRRYKFDFYYQKQFNMQLSDAEYKLVEKKFSDLLKSEYYPKLELLPGALELLKYTKQSFDFSFVSSGVPMEEINYLVNLNGISKYFDLVLGTDETYKTKNNHFKKIIDEKNPDILIFIADGLEDMKVTKEFSVIQSIAITSNHSKEELIDAGAKNVVDNLNQALSLIEHL